MKDFISKNDMPVLAANGLADFEALWQLKLVQVDEPNIRRGGISSVCRLQLKSGAYYLKRHRYKQGG